MKNINESIARDECVNWKVLTNMSLILLLGWWQRKEKNTHGLESIKGNALEKEQNKERKEQQQTPWGNVRADKATIQKDGRKKGK